LFRNEDLFMIRDKSCPVTAFFVRRFMHSRVLKHGASDPLRFPI
jgi:hypothetical protein